MKLIINGAKGAMGKYVTELSKDPQYGAEAVALVDRSFDTDQALKKYKTLEEYEGGADVLVDFSNHAATFKIVDYCVLKSLPMVIGTTGQNQEEIDYIKTGAASIPIFLSANMSLGIAVISDLIKKVLAIFPDAEVEIIETHHDRKLDVPSGTALMLAQSIKNVRPLSTINIGRPLSGKRSKEEIGIHSLRYGNVVGVHEVIISTGSETIKLSHEAFDRSLFAFGAIKAAEFIREVKKPGLYGMDDMVSI